MLTESISSFHVAPLLHVQDLKTVFHTDAGVVRAVDGVDLDIYRGEVLGLVGESGCGKSVTSLSIMRLILAPGQVVSGQALFDGQDLFRLSEAEMTQVRGDRIGMIFQEPLSSLNPVFRVGEQIAEVLRIHQGLKGQRGWKRAVELLTTVGLPDPEERANAYPHELSVGQAQRVMIAMALACSPALLIADEPTTALDVTIQAQIVELVKRLQRELGMAIMWITHDLGVVAEMADRVAVMYAGRIVEQGNVATLFDNPRHPYTQGLIASIPVLGEVKDRLDVIPGSVPDLIDLPSGCRFAPRCQARLQRNLAICSEQEPQLLPLQGNHLVRCWLYQSLDDHRAPLTGS